MVTYVGESSPHAVCASKLRQYVSPALPGAQVAVHRLFAQMPTPQGTVPSHAAPAASPPVGAATHFWQTRVPPAQSVRAQICPVGQVDDELHSPASGV